MDKWVYIAIAVFLAALAQWILWRKRIAHRRKAGLLADLRALIQRDIPIDEFRDTVEYSRIRSELSVGLRNKIESSITHHVIGGGRGSGVSHYRNDLLDEIANIERKWNLL